MEQQEQPKLSQNLKDYINDLLKTEQSKSRNDLNTKINDFIRKYKPVETNLINNNSIVNNTEQNWIMPCKGKISSPYGWREHPVLHTKKFHRGLDISAPKGTPVYAISDGVVIFANYQGPNGNCIRINHGNINGNIVKSTSIHLDRIDVKQGQIVKQGQQIGVVGSTGNYPNGTPSSTGPHLHISIYENGKDINPLKYIKIKH